MINRKEADIDITKNIKIIEGLKSQLLTEVADLFKNMVNSMKEDSREEIADCTANVVIEALLLSKRLGITYNTIGLKMEKKIRNGIIQNRDEEKYYGDLTELAHYFDVMKKKQ